MSSNMTHMDNNIIKFPLSFSSEIHKAYREKIGDEEWTAIENGNTFTLFGNTPTLEGQLKIPIGFAKYDNNSNLRTEFVYTIEKDLVFSYNFSNNTIYFLDEKKENREDVFGAISLEQDPTLVIHNKSLSPNLSIKYKFEKKITNNPSSIFIYL